MTLVSSGRSSNEDRVDTNFDGQELNSIPAAGARQHPNTGFGIRRNAWEGLPGEVLHCTMPDASR
ncbi:hypothetical protein [Streptomyces globosus]|uniref:hypothetical protein n=1 Tax=Streptomyces globosus TaxID=68209 RepID=UPI00363A598E